MVFALGPLQVSVYGILLALGTLSAYGATIALLLLRKRAEWPNINYIDSVLLWALIPAVVFARLLFVMYHIDYFGANPQEIIAVWHGGWVWHGALFGGLLGIFLYCKKVRISFLLLLDILAPGAALGQAIGRWGNFFNQEAYGLPTSLPWGIIIAPDKRLPGYETFTTFHPAFLYESVFDLVLFFFLGLLLLRRREPMDAPRAGPPSPKGFGAAQREGVVFFLYLLIYSAGRFGIEFLRIDVVPVIGGLRAPQWISLALMIIGVCGLAWVLRKQKKMVY